MSVFANVQQQGKPTENSVPAVRGLSCILKNQYILQKGANSCERVDRKFQVLRIKLMPVFIQLILKIFFLVSEGFRKRHREEIQI